MKVRQAIPITSELGDISKLAKFDGEYSWSDFGWRKVAWGLSAYCIFSFGSGCCDCAGLCTFSGGTCVEYQVVLLTFELMVISSELHG